MAKSTETATETPQAPHTDNLLAEVLLKLADRPAGLSADQLEKILEGNAEAGARDASRHQRLQPER
jgi:hypothetical protein